MDDLEVSYSDLIAIKLLIEQSSERGIISPDQFTVIGSLYDKITQYVEHEESNK